MQEINKRLEAIEKTIKSKSDIAEVQEILDKIKQAAIDNNIVNGKIIINLRSDKE